MADITLHGIPNCDTVKKARAWLDGRGIAHGFHDFKKLSVPDGLLPAACDQLGWEKVLNKQGLMWKKLAPEQRLAVVDTASAVALMLEVPSVVKRPLMRWADGSLTVGFSDALFASKVRPD